MFLSSISIVLEFLFCFLFPEDYHIKQVNKWYFKHRSVKYKNFRILAVMSLYKSATLQHYLPSRRKHQGWTKAGLSVFSPLVDTVPPLGLRCSILSSWSSQIQKIHFWYCDHIEVTIGYTVKTLLEFCSTYIFQASLHSCFYSLLT